MKLDTMLASAAPTAIDANPNSDLNEALPVEMNAFSSLLEKLTQQPQQKPIDEVLKAAVPQQSGEDSVTVENQALGKDAMDVGSLFAQMNVLHAKTEIVPVEQVSEIRDAFTQKTLMKTVITPPLDPKSSSLSSAIPQAADKIDLSLTTNSKNEKIMPDMPRLAEELESQPLVRAAKHSKNQFLNKEAIHDVASQTEMPLMGQSVKQLENQSIHQQTNHSLSEFIPLPKSSVITVPLITQAEGITDAKPAVITIELPEKSILLQAKEMHSVNIKIYPPNLGQISATLKMDKTGAELVMVADNKQIKEIIQANLPQLRDHFQQIDVKINHIDVQTNSHQQPAEQQHQQTALPDTKSYGEEQAAPQPTENKKIVAIDALVDTYA